MRITRRRLLESWWVLPVGGTAAFFAWLGVRTYNIRFGKPAPSAEPRFTGGAAHRVASAASLEKVWDAAEFAYPVRVGTVDAETPAILIRVPEAQPGGLSANGAHFLALSRVCTHLNCTCAYIRDREIATVAYNYRPEEDTPILGCACHFSAFDPARAGASVSGPALKPLPRLQLERRGPDLYAVGTEEQN